MAVLDEPDILDGNDIPILNEDNDDDSKGSSVEILDTASNADICKESELTKFNKMLCDTKKCTGKAEGKGEQVENSQWVLVVNCISQKMLLGRSCYQGLSAGS